MTDFGAARKTLAAVALLAATAAAPGAYGARILAVETYGGRSHWNFMGSLVRALTDAGHAVTAFTPFPDGHRANYTEVDTSAAFQTSVNTDWRRVQERYGTPTAMIGFMYRKSRENCDLLFADRRFVETVARADGGGARFDALLVEPLTVDCASRMARAAGLPVIYAVPCPMWSFVERDFTGHASNPAAVANVMAGHAVPETFVQRFANAALLAYITLVHRYHLTVSPRPYDSEPHVQPSIVFINTYHGSEAARPVPPNLVDVGGVHLKPVKSIPKDILNFIEESPHGVIFFTFGSTIKLSSLPKHIENAFKEALANVPQRVLWKYEEQMTDLPENVMIRKWFPQRDILMHPKVKLFISHGGVSGVYEALDAGVPVLGFPLFYDQPKNIANLVRAGMAISMDVMAVSKDSILNAISELTNNDKYMRNAKIASDRFKDRPMSPQQSVVYWTEYVIRHKGAPHLKFQGYNLTWYQYFMLDVAAVVLILVFLFVYITYIVFKFIYSYNPKQLFLRSPNNKVKTN